jgi:hypothetical protein
MCIAEDEAKREERRREAERERDQREKEEFEERLRARDDEKTRRIVEQRIPKEELEVELHPEHTHHFCCWLSAALRTVAIERATWQKMPHHVKGPAPLQGG